MDGSNDGHSLSRRAFLGSTAAGSVVLAGCLGGGEASDGSTMVPVRGNADADVTLEVYEDLTCPACRTYSEDIFPTIDQQYLQTNAIRYEHRDFPFRNQVAWDAASAAREVYAEHGTDQFWEYKSALFDQQNRIETESPALFGEVAESLDLDGDSIESAGANRSHESESEADRERGEGLGVEGTPSFVVNGDIAGGLEHAFEIIDDEL